MSVSFRGEDVLELDVELSEQGRTHEIDQVEIPMVSKAEENLTLALGIWAD